MKHLAALIATTFLACGLAAAQPGPGAGASAPRGGMGMGMGPRFGAGVTPGWTLMTPDERTAHQNAMREATTPEACAAERDKQHQAMVARAKERGQAMPAAPRRDVCAGLQK